MGFALFGRVHLDEFTTMAESYQAARADTPETLNGVDVYFFVADFGQNQLPFQRVSLAGVVMVSACSEYPVLFGLLMMLVVVVSGECGEAPAFLWARRGRTFV